MPLLFVSMGSPPPPLIRKMTRERQDSDQTPYLIALSSGPHKKMIFLSLNRKDKSEKDGRNAILGAGKQGGVIPD